ncbi:Lipase-like PAD4 [Ananas comosus]|uniref:Lipase-like PAD4 n=1 Tax=Ananas comosus TaxID=4615 RepID=A0A199UIL7_ANACO|nr:Lipase-like PAD4 [Ananas comosus]
MDALKEEEDDSMFETSHVLGSLVASSPLLGHAWRACARADAAGPRSFVAERPGGGGGAAVHVAFSGASAAAAAAAADAGGDALRPVPIGGGGGGGLFSQLVGGGGGGGGDGEEEVLVQAWALRFYVALCKTPEYQMLLDDVKDKSVVFTGHAMGGAVASLAALHFLCSSFCFTSSTTKSLLCVTFGSPLLGNEALSRAILRERWNGNFFHVVSQHDFMPRLFFCPLNSISSRLRTYLQSRHFSMHAPNEEKMELHKFISPHIAAAVTEQKQKRKLSAVVYDRSPYKPFGNYGLCSMEGMVCIDNPTAVAQMLYVTFVTNWQSNSNIEEHLSYGDLVVNISQNLLKRKRISVEGEDPKSNYESGISLALEASGIGVKGIGAMAARECLKQSKRMGQSPNLICANLAIRLGKITPCRAQIEWYKTSCDDDMGYYDAFKLRKAKKDSKANMNRIKLAKFWDSVIEMLQNNQLPYDFHKRAKWANAAQFYKLLVEPLDIAEYYRSRYHKTKGHYLTHGRERRYEIFDKWWEGKKDCVDTTNMKRSKFAGLTQDSCFWAKVEEAMEWLDDLRGQSDPAKVAQLRKKLNEFDCYSKRLVERKDVSIDVLAPRSSFRLWLEEWKDLKFNPSF